MCVKVQPTPAARRRKFLLTPLSAPTGASAVTAVTLDSCEGAKHHFVSQYLE